MGQDSDLFWQLIEREHEKALAYCGRLTGTIEDGDDLYQDAVIKAYDGFAMLRRLESFRPWFYRIISNAYKGRFRTPWWRRLVSRHEESEEFDPASDPSGFYEARRRLEYAFGVLSAEDRIIVTLFELEGWSISELAELTSGTEGFVKMRLMRARKKMRTRLSQRSGKSALNASTLEEKESYALPSGTQEID